MHQTVKKKILASGMFYYQVRCNLFSVLQGGVVVLWNDVGRAAGLQVALGGQELACQLQLRPQHVL